MSLSSSTPTSSVLPSSMENTNGTSTGGPQADSICVNGFCFSKMTVIFGASLIGLGILSLGIACIIFARQRRRRRTHNASVNAGGKEPMLETGQSPPLAAAAVAVPKRSSEPIAPMAVTQYSNARIEAGLNDMIEDIKNIANKAGARVWFDKEKGPVFVRAIQVAQGGVAPPIGGGKIEATQALRAAIAMLLTDRVLPGESQPVHPLMKSGDRREFDQWVRSQPSFEGMTKLTPDRRRLWVAKFVKENLETSAMLRAQRAEVMGVAISEVEGAIGKLYEDWDAEGMRPMVEGMVERALNLGCEMMGKDIAMTTKWVQPGQEFVDRRMDMTDLRRVDGVVALCVFPGWVDADGYMISTPKVFCV